MGETGGPAARPLAESVVVVAGGTSGIGLEAAAQLAEAGATRLPWSGATRRGAGRRSRQCGSAPRGRTCVTCGRT